MSDDKAGLRGFLKAISDESETLRLFREEPDQLAKRFNFSPAEIDALKRTDIIVSGLPRAITYTFTTGSTITAGRPEGPGGRIEPGRLP